MKTREETWAILNEYTKSPSLLNHARSVEASMLWYAKHFELSPEETLLWGNTGLIHDFDYEKYPEPTPETGHPFMGYKILGELGYPDILREAVMGHADYTGVPRTTRLAQALFACDELSGFVVACTLVRPDRSLLSLEVSSVKKRLKDKAFARGCSRDDIFKGAEELNIPLEEHIGNIILAQRGIADELGLSGPKVS